MMTSSQLVSYLLMETYQKYVRVTSMLMAVSSSTSRRSRREEYSDATRTALVDGAIELMTELGYARTSLDAIADRARVTKGALYHHFPAGKRALFEEAFQRLESDVHDRVAAAMVPDASPWEVGLGCLEAFLDACLEPAYQRIVWVDGPAVLGYAEWQAEAERHSLGTIREVVQRLISSGELAAVPVEPLSRTLFWALGAAGTSIAGAPDPKAARAEYEEIVIRLLSGLRPG
jgi:AcrR family transcriptional regulator